jgi:hypothetical protein
MKTVQKRDSVSSMDDLQKLLDSEDERQAVTDVEMVTKYV